MMSYDVRSVVAILSYATLFLQRIDSAENIQGLFYLMEGSPVVFFSNQMGNSREIPRDESKQNGILEYQWEFQDPIEDGGTYHI